MKKELITGITGQDGSYLSEILLEKGSEMEYSLEEAIADWSKDCNNKQLY